DQASRSNRRSAVFPNRLEVREASSRRELPTGSANARGRSHEAPEESVCPSFGFSGRSRQIEGAVDRFHECAFFANNDALGFRCLEILARVRVEFQLFSIRFVGGEAIESNQAPGHVVCAFIREKIAHQMATRPSD